MPGEAEKRKLRLHISLRADVMDALEHVSEECSMHVSRLVETFLAFQHKLGA